MGTPAIGPPPDTGPMDVPRTGKERVLGAVGGVLSAGSGQDAASSPLEKEMQRQHDIKLATAKRHYQNWTNTGAMLGTGEIDPNTGSPTGTNPDGSPMTPVQRQKLQNEHDGAYADYAKIAGVSKEAKASLQKHKGLMDILINKGHEAMKAVLGAHQKVNGGGGGAQGGGGMTPPPATGAAPGGAADANMSASSAPGAASATVPPPPIPPPAAGTKPAQGASAQEEDTAQLPRRYAEWQQSASDKRELSIEQKKADIEQKLRIAVEQAKPPSSTASRTAPPATDAYYSLLDQTNPDTGEKYTPQEALKMVTEATTKAGKPTPFQEYMSDPTQYAKFEKEMTAAKQGQAKNASIGAVYGIYRMMEMGYKQNPEILPLVAAMAPEVFKKAGMAVPPQMTAILGKIPLDQPLSPTTGAPIGTSMPGAPTTSTRNQAQTAARALTELPSVRKQVDDLKGYLGPGEGRINVRYLLGKAGSTGDPQKDEKLSELRTHLMFLAGAAAKFHLNSVRAMHDFESIADAGKDSAEALQGFLNTVEEWGTTAEKQQKGFGEAGGSKMSPPPSPSGGSKSDPLGIR
jgi:hypothetical protein